MTDLDNIIGPQPPRPLTEDEIFTRISRGWGNVMRFPRDDGSFVYVVAGWNAELPASKWVPWPVLYRVYSTGSEHASIVNDGQEIIWRPGCGDIFNSREEALYSAKIKCKEFFAAVMRNFDRKLPPLPTPKPCQTKNDSKKLRTYAKGVINMMVSMGWKSPEPKEKWLRESDFNPRIKRVTLGTALSYGVIEIDKGNELDPDDRNDWKFRFTERGRARLNAITSAAGSTPEPP